MASTLQRFVLALLSLSFITACGDDDVTSGDSGAADSGFDDRDADGPDASDDAGPTDAGLTDGGRMRADAGPPPVCIPSPASSTLELPAPTPLPAGIRAASAVYHTNISYGSDARNRLDIYLAASATPTPLVIYIHGGGFTGGRRNFADARTLQPLFDAGVSFATIGYRLLATDGTESDGVEKSLTDSQRALQFLRYHATALNIDPERVALRGSSAGAGTSLWIATKDESCDPTAADPILGMSTRVVAAGAVETQGTYDIVRWETTVFGPTYPLVTLENIVAVDPSLYERLGAFYGLPPTWRDLSELEREPLVSYRARVDMLGFLDPSDPPMYLSNTNESPSMPADLDALLHHPLHADVFYDTAIAAGVEGMELRTPERMEGPSENLTEFFLTHL